MTAETRHITLLKQARECVARGDRAIDRQIRVLARRQFTGFNTVAAEARLADMYAWQIKFRSALESLESTQPKQLS
jgi:hypothetical protein